MFDAALVENSSTSTLNEGSCEVEHKTWTLVEGVFDLCPPADAALQLGSILPESDLRLFDGQPASQRGSERLAILA